MKGPEIKALVIKVVVFSLVGALFWMLTPTAGLLTYGTLVVLAAVWLLYELAQPKKRPLVRDAFLLGLFLMVFDFVVENLGFFAGLWTSPQSLVSVISVPIEIMVLTLVGGTAWALHLPLKLDTSYLAIESLIFGAFGALGEYLLILNGMMIYTNGWTSFHAFVGYVVTWIILFGVWYKGIRKGK
ncbi:MAG: hypothetical protein HY369_04430 [Candidatus Aenigmarchaeota archaeon]|nr:hypothetical protein [Candidatus Aenigmarchaeota archaeon]